MRVLAEEGIFDLLEQTPAKKNQAGQS